MTLPTILHKYRYITVRDAARMVLKTRAQCRTQTCTYLDCVVDWASLGQVTHAFSEALGRPAIAHPDAFLQWYQTEFVKTQPRDVFSQSI